MSKQPQATMLIRVDSDTQIGVGHFMRCLSLAQSWADTGRKVLFASVSRISLQEKRLDDEGIPNVMLQAEVGGADDAEQTAELASDIDAICVVLDGYSFDSDYQRRVRSAGCPIVILDDGAQLDGYDTDLLIDQNLGSSRSVYPMLPDGTRALIGPQFTLLRREFLNNEPSQRSYPDVGNRVLVTLGGADPDNVTAVVLRSIAASSVEDIKSTVISSQNELRNNTLKELIEQCGLEAELISNAMEMPKLMAEADLAISACGSTCWELAWAGLPSITVSISDRQEFIGESIDRVGISRYLGPGTDISPLRMAREIDELLLSADDRKQMSLRGMSLIDGLGPQRIIAHILSAKLTLRPANKEDIEITWKWANDPQARTASFSSDPITHKDHTGWFEKNLVNQDSVHYIVMNPDATPIGQVRFDIEAGSATISVSLDSSTRGSGLGPGAIWLACAELFKGPKHSLVHAYVKPDNVASVRAFRIAGFIEAEPTVIEGNEARHLTLSKEVIA